ncbi:hypothetical protein Mal4_35040 [Maioricimonas rarisocia]|uniref:DUF2062 domain-containing protein n=1 Tax=Maioricimonas rarisocia TaxID=2528026 RepID=A0A517Z9K7_9PLAN|nr:DUF2062 domain-containing protein [Maioricimonas rarisocia]QDU39168.1 hypothetical protein Mal4_35040 [Maioricimonas rarisocia]
MSQNRLYWYLHPRRLLHAVLTVDDSPHSIALGTAIGMAVAMTPTVGIQMIIVLIVAFLTCRLFSFSRVAALITVYVSNPFTVIPIYWFNYKVGTLFVHGTVTHEEFASLLHYEGLRAWWDSFCALFLRVGAPLLIGSAIVATLVGLITYPLMRRLLASMPRKKSHTVKPPQPIGAPERTEEQHRVAS